MGTRRVLAAVVECYRSAGRKEKGRIIDELTAVIGWHRKQAVRALSGRAVVRQVSAARRRGTCESVSDALTALRPVAQPLRQEHTNEEPRVGFSNFSVVRRIQAGHVADLSLDKVMLWDVLRRKL